jgi:hypothetical protein
MNFPLDSSTQTNTALTTTGTSYTYVNTNDLSTKQNILDASTNLLGIGTNISALNYLNISVNKPTNFQSDWNSTIINKPTNFQSDWNSTIINKPTNFQSDWNSTIINKPDLTVYAIKNNVDSSLNSLNNNKQNNLTFSSPLVNTSNTISSNESSITTLTNFYNKTETDTLVSSTWTKTGNDIYTIIGTNVGIGVTNPSGRLELNFDNSIKLKFGNTTGPRTWNVNQLFTNFFF